MIDAFATSIEDAGRSKATVRAYRSDMKMFADWSADLDVSAETITLQAARWLNSCRSEVAPKTTHRRLGTLRAYVAWLGLPLGPLEGYKKPTPKKTKPHPLKSGMEGVRAMMGAARNSAHRTLIVLQGFGGMRVSEALSVTVADVDVDSGVVTITGKGDKMREIPFDRDGEAFGVIIDRIREVGTGPLVGLPDRTARYTVTALAKKVGAASFGKTQVSSHDLRATSATSLHTASGNNIRLVQEFLGHANVKQTEIYVGVTREQFAEAVKGL